VILDSEIGVIFPGRMVEAKGNLGELLAIARQQMKPRFDVPQEFVERNVALEEKDRSDVGRTIARFRI